MACSRASRSSSSRYSMVSVGIANPPETSQGSWSSLITPDGSKIERGTPISRFLPACWMIVGFHGPIGYAPGRENVLESDGSRHPGMRRAVFGLLGLWVVGGVLAGASSSPAAERAGVTFERDVEPILTRAGCN